MAGGRLVTVGLSRPGGISVVRQRYAQNDLQSVSQSPVRIAFILQRDSFGSPRTCSLALPGRSVLSRPLHNGWFWRAPFFGVRC